LNPTGTSRKKMKIRNLGMLLLVIVLLMFAFVAV